MSSYIEVPAGTQVYGYITDPFTWIWMQTMSLVGPILLFILIGVGAWMLYDNMSRTPLESKIIKACSLSKKPLLILEHDAGYLEFKVGQRLGVEGAVHTRKEGKTKRHWTGFFPRSSKNRATLVVPDDAGEEVKVIAAVTQALAQDLGDYTVERKYLRGAKVPVHVGYTGKGVLTNIKTMAALKTCEILQKVDPVFTTLVSLGHLKTLFAENWNQSQIEANETDAALEGELNAKKFAGKGEWVYALIGIGIFFGGLAALVAVVHFFGG